MNTEITHSHQLKITNVIPVTIQAARGYPAWIVVKVETDGGLEGIGEGFTWAGQARTISDCIASIGQQIKNTPATQIRSFLNRFPPRAGDRNWSAAVSAIEVALWDILGKAANLPVYALLGGKVRDKIPLYADHGIFGGADSWGECVERILAVKEDGFGMFKWDPFEGSGTPEPGELRNQVKKVETVRDAVGTDYQIAIDAHNRFSVEGAIMAARALEPLDVLFFEAPTVDEPEQLKTVADATSIPIATGELTCTRQEAKTLFDSGTLGLFQPEVGTNGGILETVKTAELAETYGLNVAPHNWCSPVVTRAASHACSVISNLLYQEYAGGAPVDSWENELLIPITQVENGHLILPDLPGLGFELNQDLIASKLIE